MLNTTVEEVVDPVIKPAIKEWGKGVKMVIIQTALVLKSRIPVPNINLELGLPTRTITKHG